MGNWDIQVLKQQAKAFDRRAVYAEKVKRVQEEMRKNDLNVIISLKPQNTFALSGFNPILYSHPVAVIVPAEGEATLLVHSLRANHSKDQAALTDIRLFGAWGTQKPIADDAYTAISIILDEKKRKGGRVGYEGDFLSLVQYNKIKELSQAGEMVNVQDLLLNSRMIKTEYEITLLKMASYLANIGMEAAIAHIRESEIEASISAEIAMRKAWSRDLGEYEVSSFGNTEGGVVNALWCYSCSGPRVPYGCECPSDRVPSEGEVCLPVCWAAIDGCHTENERTVMIGDIDEWHLSAYKAMNEGRKRAFAMMREGVTAGEVYAAATSAYVEAGFQDYLPGRVGHGMGQSLHEVPSLSRNSSMVLKEGMVCTVEPGLVFPGWGSTRHSDTVVIRKEGIEILTCFDEEFIKR